jgi:hypothetical protein
VRRSLRVRLDDTSAAVFEIVQGDGMTDCDRPPPRSILKDPLEGSRRMRGRERRQERREERREGEGRGDGKNRYLMREKLVSLGDDFWIEKEDGQRVFRVDGKALRVRKTLNFEDANGERLATIQERMLRVKDSMEVEGPGGERLAMVKKALISPLRDRFTVKIEDGPTCRSRATSSTTNTRSAKVATKSPRSPRSGSAFVTPTASRSIPDSPT